MLPVGLCILRAGRQFDVNAPSRVSVVDDLALVDADSVDAVAAFSGPGAVPLELRAVLDRDPAAKAMWDALSPTHRTEYCEFVSEAKKPETRVRRATKTVELMQRRRSRKAELKARGPAPITTAIDEALTSVIAPDLKAMGFRKRRRNWRASDDGSARVVGTHAGQLNQTNTGWFRVVLGVDWAAFGPLNESWDAEIGRQFACSIGRSQERHHDGHFRIDRADDPVQRRDLTSDLAAAWDGPLGREAVRCATDPAVLCEHLIQNGELRDLLHAVRLGRRTERVDLQQRAIAGAFEALRENPEVRQPATLISPVFPSDVWLTGAVKDIEYLLGHVDRLGVDLSSTDHSRIEEIVNASLTVLDEDDSDDEPSMTATDLIREAPSLLAVAEWVGINAAPTVDRALARRDPAQPWRRVSQGVDER